MKKLDNGNIQEQIGQRIAECRKKKGLKQAELADILKKSSRTVQAYESGETDLSISTLAAISHILGVSMNYLIGYEPSAKLESLSDVLAFLFELDKKNELNFTIDVSKPAEGSGDLGEWAVSIKFDGHNSNAEYNSSLCLALEKLRDKRQALEEYWIDYETIEAWEKSTLEYNQNAFLSDKQQEVLDSTELIKRRNELFNKKMQEMYLENQNEQRNKK